MGLFSAIVMLPLAPVRGVAWVAEQVADEAERELYGEGRIRRELLQARMDREAGLIDEQEEQRRADELIARLAAGRRMQTSWAAPTSEEATDDG